MASNGVTRPPALDVTMQEILDALKAVSFRPQVIDNLTSQDTGAPLSANQGRVLKDAIDGLVTQSITDGDTSHAPSGDAVHDALNAIKSPTNKDANLYTAGGGTLSTYNQNTETSQYILDIATNRMQSFSFKTFYDTNGTEWFYLIGKGYPLFSGIRISHTGTLQKFYGDVNNQTVTVITV